jgi:hypothetical protein
MKFVFCPNCSGITTKRSVKINDNETITDYVCDYDFTVIKIKDA